MARRKPGPKKKVGRPRKVVEPDVSVEKKRPGRKMDMGKAFVYANAVTGGMREKDARELAGYKTHRAKELPAVRHAFASIEKERESLQQTAGMTMTDIATRFMERAKGENVSDSVKNDADKALLGMLDYTPSKKVDIHSTGMLMEFRDVSMGQLLELRNRRIAELQNEEIEAEVEVV